MKRLLPLALLLLAAPSAAAAGDAPKPTVTGLVNPESVCVTPAGTFVTTIGEFDKDGDGAVMKLEPGGKAIPVSCSWKLKGYKLCRTLEPIESHEICETWFKGGRNQATVLADGIFGINKW